MKKALRISVSGIVQGVGFRPFVYRLAAQWGLTGWVCNANDGVHIHLEGEEASLQGFSRELSEQAPPAARVTAAVQNWNVAPEGYSEFAIRQSRGSSRGVLLEDSWRVSQEDSLGDSPGVTREDSLGDSPGVTREDSLGDSPGVTRKDSLGDSPGVTREDSREATQEGSYANTLVSPDIAICQLCLTELFNPDDRRYHYPFINCTNCGPRFTIIDSLPYDRKNTSMAAFEMCEACEKEYGDPLDRRFHAQPDACFECGPSLRLVRPGCDVIVAVDRASSDSIIKEVVTLIEAGGIVAIKGLGGYHLACDATNEEAVVRLRARKNRPAKPFALMVRGLENARALCRVSEQEAALLTGTVRPIVLLERKPANECLATVGSMAAESRSESCPSAGSAGAKSIPAQTAIAHAVAGDLHELGIMLPCTPLQHLLLAAVDKPLVMTSGNISEEPIISAEAEAHMLLGGVADAFLDNDREILSRYDDSVVRVIDERVYMIRRARGYAPQPIDLPGTKNADAVSRSLATSQTTDILATGPEQKNCFCLVRDNQAFVSQHLGDLENASTFEAWLSTLGLYQRLFDLRYQKIACDKHPAYLSTQWARSQGESLLEVQHHHAHIASVLAECNSARIGCPSVLANSIGIARNSQLHLQLDRVIGIAFDGIGYGEDGTVWGGEVLLASLSSYERFAHLCRVPLPGGQAAIKHPARMAWSYLRSLGLAEHEGAAPLAARIGKDRLLLLDQIIANRINSPLTSSMGRLFDAVSALIGICYENSYEGQAAIELEASLYDHSTQEPVIDPTPDESDLRYRFTISAAQKAENATTALPLDCNPTPVLAAILDDLQSRVFPALISLRFHLAVARLIVDICNEARRQTGLIAVALSGGVFMNRYLLSRVIPLLAGEGFVTLMNHELPANDGCISYGQAAVAAARLIEQREQGIMYRITTVTE